MSLCFDYHRSMEHLHVGCDKPRAYFIPYGSDAAARVGNRAASDRFLSLCGEWSFRYYKSVGDVPDFTAPDFSADAERLDVPMSWQMALGRGYDLPNYVNSGYQFSIDPPYVPDDDPCGLYERDFEIDAETLKNRKIKLVFEGVASCFYVYVNNKFVAYSQVSHSTSEIPVDEYLVAGKNNVKVLVLKWGAGSYLEDQDMFRLSGIFREVYLLLRDPIHLTDIHVKACLDDVFRAATLTAELTSNGKTDAAYTLVDPNGKEIANGSFTVDGSATLTLDIDSPILWSDETPNLYELYLTVGEEHIRQEIGVRKYEIRGKVLYVNGKKVKGKGVNRHDTHPKLGYATPLDHIVRDLYIFKAHNINLIRTSHYPNDPRLPELCDRLGFYLCNEADLETHALKLIGSWGEYSDSPDWTEAYLDRVERLFERDKNHACVLFWSLGNESGWGRNFTEMSRYLKSRDSSCFVLSDSVSRTQGLKYINAKTAAERKLVDSPDIDIEARMYLNPEESLKFYIYNRNVKKPFMLCEYSHAMGNRSGDLEAYWQAIYKHDAFFGACVWEYCDHSVDIGTVGNPRYAYGGDFKEEKSLGNFCADGLAYPDRRVHSGMLEYKQVLRPVRLTAFDPEKQTVTLRNMRYFTSLSDLDMLWSIERNGKVIREGRVASMNVPPQSRKTYKLDLGDVSALDGFCYLNLSFRSNVSHPWAAAGYEVAMEQVKLDCADMPKISQKTVVQTFAVTEDEKTIRITDGACVYTVDRLHGLIASMIGDGKELLTTTVTPTVWRAPTDNDRGVKIEWQKVGFHRIHIKCYECNVTEATENEITVKAKLSLGAIGRRPVIRMDVTYKFVRNEGVTVTTEAERCAEFAVFLPRFGFTFQMPADCEQLRYFGRGPVESYRDKCHASHVGLFTTTVTDHFEHYIRPQENMAHIDTHWFEVANLAGQGLLATGADGSAAFSFNCSHFTDKQLTATAHDYELVPMADTVVHIDYMHSGIGSASCATKLAPEWQMLEKSFGYSFRLQPVRVNDTCPFEKAVK